MWIFKGMLEKYIIVSYELNCFVKYNDFLGLAVRDSVYPLESFDNDSLEKYYENMKFFAIDTDNNLV